MSKIVNENEFKGSPIKKVMEHLNKHGKIKGDNKKQTKAIKALCVHHRLNKKGKVVMDIHNNGDGTCSCLMCDHEFDTKLASKQELDKILGDMIRLNDQAKFMAVGIDAGDETIKFLTATSVYLANYKKTYEKISSIAKRQDAATGKKNKKGKGGNNNGGSGNYGSWG